MNKPSLPNPILLTILFALTLILSTSCGESPANDSNNNTNDCVIVTTSKMDSERNCIYADENPRSFCLAPRNYMGEVAPIYYYSETSDEIVIVEDSLAHSSYETLKQAGFTTCYENHPEISPGCQFSGIQYCASLDAPQNPRSGETVTVSPKD